MVNNTGTYVQVDLPSGLGLVSEYTFLGVLVLCATLETAANHSERGLDNTSSIRLNLVSKTSSVWNCIIRWVDQRAQDEITKSRSGMSRNLARIKSVKTKCKLGHNLNIPMT